MKLLILLLGALILGCLAAEKHSAVRHRRALRHVIHVNGTRGKSGVARLIAAGLAGAGFKTFCKTTGTLPMTIDTSGNEHELRRRGPSNIREQLKILRMAHEDGAEILVAECMALDPELQAVSQHEMLRADVTVITNCRIDHVAEMGATVEEVCDALCATVPKNGVVFTADSACYPQISAAAARLGSRAELVSAPPEGFPGLEEPFPENIALALAVCRSLGADEASALEGMRHVKKDPYTASLHRLPGGALFLNGMSANDPLSTELLPGRFPEIARETCRTVYLLNTRGDRGYRTDLMLKLLRTQSPEEVWLLGDGSAAARRRLRGVSAVHICRSVSRLPLDEFPAGTLVYAIGNIAGPGMELMERIGKEGTPLVR